MNPWFDYLGDLIYGQSTTEDDEDEEWRLQETRQTYRIVEDNDEAIKVEAYEVEIYVDEESNDVMTSVEDYLWGDWFAKKDFVEWPEPLAEVYLEARVGSELNAVDDFWVL